MPISEKSVFMNTISFNHERKRPNAVLFCYRGQRVTYCIYEFSLLLLFIYELSTIIEYIVI